MLCVLLFAYLVVAEPDSNVFHRKMLQDVGSIADVGGGANSEDASPSTLADSVSTPSQALDWLELVAYVWNGNTTHTSTQNSETLQDYDYESEYRVKLSRALDVLSVALPSEARRITRHRTALIETILSGEPPPATSPLALVPYHVNVSAQSDTVEAALTYCEERMVNVVASTVSMIFAYIALFKLPGKFNGNLVTGITRMIPRCRTLFKSYIRAISRARGVVATGTAVLGLFKYFVAQGGQDVILKALQDSFTSWWDYLSMAAQIAMFVGGMLASGGLAAILVVANKFLASVQWVNDVATAVSACGG